MGNVAAKAVKLQRSKNISDSKTSNNTQLIIINLNYALVDGCQGC